MKSLSVREVSIGEGKPKIVVSIFSETKEELIADAMSVLDLPIDIVEWRADWFKDVTDNQAVKDVLKNLRKTLGSIPLIFTLRTSDEGGEIVVDERAYLDINLNVIQSGFIDIVDIEVFRGDDIAKSLIELAGENQVKTIGSFHDFLKTPSLDTLFLIIHKMQNLGVDLSKIAVMPETKKDVITLLEASLRIKEEVADRPFVIIGMGKLGIITRMAGGLFGTSITFGAIEKPSAPGQVEVNRLADLLELFAD